MNTGKIPNQALQDHIISRFQTKRQDVLIGPGVGRDCSVIDFGEEVCVISTDPITGAANQIGYLGVHISCNDIATMGAESIGVTLTLLAPPQTTMAEIEQIITDANRASMEIGVDVLGGHTEITTSVERVVLSVTAVGRIKKQNLVLPELAQIGDQIVVTKKAGMEGTAILAHDKGDILKPHLGQDVLQRAQSFMSHISVVREGRIAGLFGAHGMHDATEGGVLGALWEMAEAMGKGIEISTGAVQIADETRQICDFFDINPLRLISSGTMIIVAPDGDKLVKELQSQGVDAAVVGRVIDGSESFMITKGERLKLDPPESDELYKVVK